VRGRRREMEMVIVAPPPPGQPKGSITTGIADRAGSNGQWHSIETRPSMVWQSVAHVLQKGEERPRKGRRQVEGGVVVPRARCGKEVVNGRLHEVDQEPAQFEGEGYNLGDRVLTPRNQCRV
jgi:hypothetical protein